MTDYECPDCGGGFPAADADGACPWCGEAMAASDGDDAGGKLGDIPTRPRPLREPDGDTDRLYTPLHELIGERRQPIVPHWDSGIRLGGDTTTPADGRRSMRESIGDTDDRRSLRQSTGVNTHE